MKPLQKYDEKKIIEIEEYMLLKKKANENNQTDSLYNDFLKLEAYVKNMKNRMLDHENYRQNLGNDTIIIKEANIDSIKKKTLTCNCEQEKMVLDMKIRDAVPVITIIYIILSSMAIAFFGMCIFIYSNMKIAIINPVESILFLIGSVGLLITSVTSIYDWRKFLKNV